MGLDFAIDELYAAGWSALDTSECEFAPDGRAFPMLDRIRREFESRGSTIETRHVQLFDCYRAEWTECSDAPAGAVVGHTEAESAVYALSQFLRSMAATAVAGS
ncbi:MAG: hypothetical protein AAGB51_01935 [Planctomycetota bacterium]